MADEDEIHKRLASDLQQFELFNKSGGVERFQPEEVEDDLDLMDAIPTKEKKRDVDLGDIDEVEVIDDPTVAYIHAGQTGAGVGDQQASREGAVPEKQIDIPAVTPVEPIEAVEQSAIVEPSAAVPRPEVAPTARGVGIEAELEGEFIPPSIPRFGIRPVFAPKLEMEPTEMPSGVVPVLADAAVEAPALMPVRAIIEPASADEDAIIQLDIQLSQYGVGETVSVIISNLPEGAVLSAGTIQDDGSWLLEAKDLAGLTMSMPENVSGVFNLYVEVITQTELSTPVSNYYSLPVNIEPIADQPSLQVSLTDNYDGSYSLVIDAALQDVDGSEVLAIGLRGVPPLTIVRDGTNVVIVGEDGSVDLTGFDLSNISLFSPEEQISFSFYIYAQAIDEADVAETMQQMDIYVNQEPEDLSFAQVTLAENATGGVLVGQAAAIDPNAHEGDVVSYSLSADTPDIFIIDPNTGQIFLADGAMLDYETEPSYAITVVATDTYGGIASRSFVVDVSNVPEAPTDIMLDNLSLNENVSGAVVGALDVADQDFGGSHTYIVSDDRFEVVDGNLKLIDSVSLNHEVEPSVLVDVTVTDESGLSYVESFTIDVGNVAEAPTDITLDNLSVFENDKGAVIGNISALDEDVGDTATYSVSDPRFIVSAGRLKLAPGEILDFETEPQVSIDVTVTDSAGLSYTETFTIDVLNESEAPTDIIIDNLSVDEATDGAVVGNISVVDPDAGGTHTIVVDDDRFEVVDGQLKLIDGVSLDFEGDKDIRINVTATDEAGDSYNERFVVTVNDINEPPVDIVLANDSVDENTAGAVVGALSVVDPDAGDTHTYVVSDARFEVVDGELKLVDGVSLDFEGEPSINIDVTATDENGLSFTETLTVNVVDTGDAPTDIIIDNLSVMENDAGAIIGNVSVVDPDVGDSFSYVVSDPRFSITKGQLILDRKEALDFETEPTVSIDVTATDSDGLTYTETFVIDVLNESEAPTDIELDNLAVDEGSAGLVVGNLVVTDPDVGDSYTYSLSDARFEVVGDELRLKPGEVLDYEPEPVVDIDITATDNDGNSYTETFSLNVGDIVWPEDIPPAGLAVDNSYTADADTIRGGNQPDILWGGEGDDTLLGNRGDDEVYGGTGDDTLSGGAGADTLYGGSGADVIEGGEGADILSGGAGDDLFNFDVDGGNDVIAGGEGSDTLDLSAMADAGIGWTIAFADGSSVEGEGADYLDLSSESAGIITFDDGTEVQFEGLEDINW